MVAPISAPMLQMVPLPVAERFSAPSPKYSTMQPVPPFTVKIPATFKITSFAEVHPLSLPVNFTPINLADSTKPFVYYQLNEDNNSANIKPGVEEIFNENPELSKIGTVEQYSQYLDTIKSNVILPTDRIVFGHPTIGKSFLKNQGEDKFISLDDDYATEINNKVKEIADKYNVTTYQVKDGGTQSWNNEYNQMMQEMFNVAKQRAISENKTLFTSNTNLLKNNVKSFDKVINLTDKEFERRIQERGAKYDTKKWKSQINEAISKLPANKVINTDKYLSDLFLGSKADIQGFKEFAQGKQFQKLTAEEKAKTIEQVTKEQNNSLFGLNTQNQEQLEFHINTLNVVSQFLENIGIEQRLVSEFLSQDGSVVEEALAAANFIEGTVDIIDDLNKGRAEA